MDASGAVIVGAKIQAKDVNTGVTYSGNTDGQGRYILPEMQVGTYDVSAEKSGFQEMVQTGVVLSVGARPVLDFKLPVGRAAEKIEVRSQASRVDTETAAVGTLVSSNQMENLPSNGRNFTDLLSMAPGVATVPASPGGGGQSDTVYGEQTNYSVSGSRPVGLAYMLDDTDIRDWLDHGAGISVMGTSLGMEAIQEFSDSDQHLQRGIRRHRRGRQRGHQVGHQRPSRLGVRIHAQQRPGLQELLRRPWREADVQEE